MEGELIDTIISLETLSWFNASRVLFYIDTHAVKEGNKYYLHFGPFIEADKFFSLITSFAKWRLDIIIISCYAGSTAAYLQYLPPNTNLVLFSDSESTSNPLTISDIFDVMS